MYTWYRIYTTICTMYTWYIIRQKPLVRRVSPVLRLSSSSESRFHCILVKSNYSRIFTRKVHMGKNLYMGESAEIYWKYNIFGVFFCWQRQFVFVHWDQEGWRDDSTLHNSLSKHIFQIVHNFVNKFVQFWAQIVFNCEARRLKQFVGSA